MGNHHEKSQLRCWYIESLCLGITIGFCEVLLAIYYGSMKIDAVTLAVFITVPAALGALTQMGLTNLKAVFRNAKNLALTAIGVQIAGLILLSSTLMHGDSLSPQMFIGQCLYWIGGMTAVSPTQEILAHKVSTDLHNRFFSLRALITTLLTLICNLSSARFLELGLTPNLLSALLGIAAAARMVSLVVLAKHAGQVENYHHSERSEQRSTQDSIVPILKLSLFMLLFRCAVNLSSPFYTTYMLQEVSMSFSVYSALTAIPLIVKTACLTNWARLLDDNRKFEGLALATFIIGLVPILWSVGSSTPWLALLQTLSGLSWAGFDLISVLLVQSMYPQSITKKLGLFLALSSIGSVMGGIVGGIFLEWKMTYQHLFSLSGILRLVTGFGFLWYLRKYHLFRFQNLNLKSGIVTLITVRPSIEAAAKILPFPQKKYPQKRNIA